MIINKPIPFIEAIKLGVVVTLRLSKLGLQKVLKYPKNINVSRKYGFTSGLIEK